MNWLKKLMFAGAFVYGAMAFAEQNEFTQELNTYVGKTLILRSYGDSEMVSVKRKNLNFPSETCDKAVEVLKASYKKNKIVFRLEQIGNIRAGGASRCFRIWSETEFAITDLGDMSSQDFSSMLQDVLLTPEAYLARNGKSFNLQRSEDAGPIGFPGKDITYPKAVLEVNPSYTEEARMNRANGIVLASMLVGTDGRVHSSKIMRSPGYGLDKQALRVLPLWRFEPARIGDKAVAMQVQMEFSFALY